MSPRATRKATKSAILAAHAGATVTLVSPRWHCRSIVYFPADGCVIRQEMGPDGQVLASRRVR